VHWVNQWKLQQIIKRWHLSPWRYLSVNKLLNNIMFFYNCHIDINMCIEFFTVKYVANIPTLDSVFTPASWSINLQITYQTAVIYLHKINNEPTAIKNLWSLNRPLMALLESKTSKSTLFQLIEETHRKLIYLCHHSCQLSPVYMDCFHCKVH